MVTSIAHQETIIRRMEDELLISKDPWKIEQLKEMLNKKRIELVKLKRKQGSV